MQSRPKSPSKSCDDEQIQLIQLVQKRGLLIAAQPDRTIHWVSDNCLDFCGLSPGELLGQKLTEFVSEQQVKSLYATAKKDKALTVPLTFRMADIRFRYNCLAYMSGDSLVLELEELGLDSESVTHQKNSELARLLKFDKNQSSSQMLQSLAEGVERLTDFDKVMIYRFHPDWHGEVVAETNSGKLPNYLGLHFPASDIPAPARELFKSNWVRQISNVGEKPSKILSYSGSKPLELWLSGLRAAAPIHVEYLQNMNVAASLTLSLMCDGELWGLIACHQTSPKVTPLWTRSMCEILAKAASFQLTKLVSRETESMQLQTVHKFDSLQASLIEAADAPTYLAAEQEKLSAMTDATTCILLVNNKFYGADKLDAKLKKELVEKLSSSVASYIVCENLAGLNPAAANFPQYSGMLAARLEMDKNSWMLWFKPEYQCEISWGGNPDKTITSSELGENHPRASFQAFLQEVKLHSRPWSKIQVTLGRNLAFLVTQKLLGKTIALADTREYRSNYLATLLADISAPVNQAISTLNILLKSDTSSEEKELLQRVINFHEELRTTIKEYVAANAS